VGNDPVGRLSRAVLYAGTALESRPTIDGLRATHIAIFLVALLQLGAFLQEGDWIRQGNAAFARDDLDKALAFYEKAEDATADPGLVAFNKAAVLYRLKRYREAELHYRRCLDDDSIPSS